MNFEPESLSPKGPAPPLRAEAALSQYARGMKYSRVPGMAQMALCLKACTVQLERCRMSRKKN